MSGRPNPCASAHGVAETHASAARSPQTCSRIPVEPCSSSSGDHSLRMQGVLDADPEGIHSGHRHQASQRTAWYELFPRCRIPNFFRCQTRLWKAPTSMDLARHPPKAFLSASRPESATPLPSSRNRSDAFPVEGIWSFACSRQRRCLSSPVPRASDACAFTPHAEDPWPTYAFCAVCPTCNTLSNSVSLVCFERFLTHPHDTMFVMGRNMWELPA